MTEMDRKEFGEYLLKHPFLMRKIVRDCFTIRCGDVFYVCNSIEDAKREMVKYGANDGK